MITATVQKVRKLGVPSAQTGWREMSEWARQPSAKGLVDRCLAPSAQIFSVTVLFIHNDNNGYTLPQAVENHYESCQNSFCVSSALGRPCSHPKPERLMEPLPVHFAPPVDSDSGWLSQPLLTLDLEEEGKTANGWKILPVTIPTEVI